MFMKQEKLKSLLNKCINDTEQQNIHSLADLVTEMKSALKENGFTDNKEGTT